MGASLLRQESGDQEINGKADGLRKAWRWG
jgi:hypothetical protein